MYAENMTRKGLNKDGNGQEKGVKVRTKGKGKGTGQQRNHDFNSKLKDAQFAAARQISQLKSPSDMTIYTPALRKQCKMDKVNSPMITDNAIEKISHFVEQVRR